ncbi:hypothetical protein FRAHR75_1180006 [Frankia sp. Hr75.2]|nr:hypothetical protein FRAHR75_1180006 [Frankia sp. Hr75.2]
MRAIVWSGPGRSPTVGVHRGVWWAMLVWLNLTILRLALTLTWINGPNAVGRTQVAHNLHRGLPGSFISDPEHLGFAMRRMLPKPGGLRGTRVRRRGLHGPRFRPSPAAVRPARP